MRVKGEGVTGETEVAILEFQTDPLPMCCRNGFEQPFTSCGHSSKRGVFGDEATHTHSIYVRPVMRPGFYYLSLQMSRSELRLIF